MHTPAVLPGYSFHKYYSGKSQDNNLRLTTEDVPFLDKRSIFHYDEGLVSWLQLVRQHYNYWVDGADYSNNMECSH